MTQEIKKPSPHFNKWVLYKLAIKIDYDLFCWMMLASHEEGESWVELRMYEWRWALRP